MEKLLQEACEYIRRLYNGEPEIGIILGTGLGNFANEIEIEKAIPYNFIPNFPISTVQSHFGRLIFGEIHGKKVVAMQGRFHYYEGYSMQQITFPVRVMKTLGVHTLFLSNASGALNLDYQNGDLVILDDHINLQPANPLIGPNLDDFGPRFPSMARPYDQKLTERALELAKEHNVRAHKGIYVA
ncbi:MAG: purine-nucleoside phosphorylase, partial [Bacteroidota bacterium]